MADQMGIRDFRAQAAATVRRAGAGERIIITIDGQPVAQLGPLDALDGQPTLADLAARGLVIPARRGDRPAPDLHLSVRSGQRIDRLVAGVRGR